MPLSEIDLATSYEAGKAGAQDRISAALLDADHRTIETWVNQRLVPVLRKIIRDDDTLQDKIVRLRNLHPEVSGQLSELSGVVFKGTAKMACRAVLTANVPLSGLFVTDGVVLSSGDRVLVCQGQTNPANHGIYIAAAGVWTRASDLPAGAEQGDGWYVIVAEGGSMAGTVWAVTSPGWGIIGTHPLTFTMVDGIARPLPPQLGGTGMTGFDSFNDLPVLADGTATERSLGERFADVVNVKDMGAVGDGVSDDTAAINAAIALGKPVYLPAGIYLVRNAIILGASAKILYGDGRRHTELRVDSGMNMSALGVIVMTAGDPGPTVRDLSIRFMQPSTTVRASMIQYPPAIYAAACPRFCIEHVRIARAWVGINMSGNSGGSYLDDIEVSAFSQGIYLNGSLDSLKFNNIHHWIFDLDANQQIVYKDGNGWAFDCTTSDDVHINNSLVWYVKSRFLGGFGSITNTDFDAASTLLFDSTGSADSNWSLSGCFCSSDGGRPIMQVQGNAEVNVAGATILMTNVDTSGVPIQVSGPGAEARCSLTLSGVTLRWGGGLTNSLVSAVNCALSIQGCRWHPVNNWQAVAGCQPLIRITGGVRGSIGGCTGRDITALRDFVRVTSATGCFLSIHDNVMPAYTLTFDDAGAVGRVIHTSGNLLGPNNGLSGGSPRYAAADYNRLITGTCDGSGNVTFAHGLGTTFPKWLKRASAVYKGASGEAVPMTVNYVDGVNVSLSGGAGAASRPYRMWLEFVDYEHAW